MITAEELRHVIDYDQETGVFTWRIGRPGASCGAVAGSISGDGYIQITVHRSRHKAHRLAWLHMHGCWPPVLIDHINGDKTDNRIANLRLATRSQNGANRDANKNNTSGVKGVYWARREQKWAANIKVNGKKKHIGYFRNINEAAAAYERAAIEYFGEFANRI